VTVDAKISVGIDPGKQGFIAIMAGNEIEFFPMPLIGKEVDINELDKILQGISELSTNIHCVIEDVHAKYGSSASATFSFGYVCGITEGLIMSNKIPYTKVQPKAWQKEMWQGIPIQKKPSSTGKTMINDTKLMSEMAAKRLFPDVDFRKSSRAKNPHDGKIDSLLLCEYCRRNF
jgi:hypothetical protein